LYDKVPSSDLNLRRPISPDSASNIKAYRAEAQQPTLSRFSTTIQVGSPNTLKRHASTFRKMKSMNHIVASYNVTTVLQTGKREQMERWMTIHGGKIAAIQETHYKLNAKEPRGSYTWYFSSVPHADERPHGVAIIISNDYIKYHHNVVSVSDRIMYAQFRLYGNLTLTFFSLYAPQAARETQLKHAFYGVLSKHSKECEILGPVGLLGDFNARAGKPLNKLERETLWGNSHFWRRYKNRKQKKRKCKKTVHYS
jgi:hypothetical protein